MAHVLILNKIHDIWQNEMKQLARFVSVACSSVSMLSSRYSVTAPAADLLPEPDDQESLNLLKKEIWKLRRKMKTCVITTLPDNKKEDVS